MKNEEISLQIAELAGYIRGVMPSLATKEHVNKAIAQHVTSAQHKPALSAKHMTLLISAGVALVGSLTAFLTSLAG